VVPHIILCRPTLFLPHRMGSVESIYVVGVLHLYRRCGWVEFEMCVENGGVLIGEGGKQRVSACFV